MHNRLGMFSNSAESAKEQLESSKLQSHLHENNPLSIGLSIQAHYHRNSQTSAKRLSCCTKDEIEMEMYMTVNTVIYKCTYMHVLLQNLI